MGICEQLYDRPVDPMEFVVGLFKFHDKEKLKETEMNRLRFRELSVHGIPIEVLARANLFANSDLV